MTATQPPPTVSVVMSVYNGEKYLREALGSILTQTFTDFEVVCVDDGSGDATAAILAEAAARDARVRVLSQNNRGLIASLNRGCRAARGRLIARMDDDDISHPERLQRQVEVFEREPDVVLVSSNLQIIGTQGEHRSLYNAARDQDLTTWFLLFYNYLGGHGQVMYRREAALDAGGYAAADRHAEDYGLSCRLARRGAVRILSEALLRYRFHMTSVSRQHRAEQMHFTAVVAQDHMHRTLGEAPPLDAVKTLQHFWLAGAAQGFTFPELTAVNTLDANLRDLMAAYRRTTCGQALSGEAVRRLRRRVAERYGRWAFSLSLRSREARALLWRSMRWDPTHMPIVLGRLARRAFKRWF